MKLNYKKIFTTPPQLLSERIILFILLVINFIIFFRPLSFSNISPLESAFTAALPSLSISWGWIVFLRFKFRKNEYILD